MPRSDAIIRIKNPHLRIFIEIREEEITNHQDVVVNVAIHYPANKARDNENINNVLDYHTVTEHIISHLENGRFSLLKKLAQGVLNIACEHHWVICAEMEIDKLHTLRYADSVSMTMGWRR